MKRTVRSVAAVLAAAVLLGSLSGCENKEEAGVEAQLQGSGRVTLCADGKEYVVLDGAGKNRAAAAGPGGHHPGGGG